MPKHQILIIDDNPSIRQLLKLRLEKSDFLVSEAGSGQIALDLIKTTPFSAIILDLKMPDLDGIAFLKHPTFKKLQPKPHVIVFTSAEFDYTRQESLKLGVDAYFKKTDTEESELVDHVAHLLIDQ